MSFQKIGDKNWQWRHLIIVQFLCYDNIRTTSRAAPVEIGVRIFLVTFT